MQLQTGEWAILFSILAMVLFSVWEADKEKIALLEGRKSKIRAYQEAMLFMWLPTFLLLALLLLKSIDSKALGVSWQGTMANWVGIAVVCLVIGYFAYSLYSLYVSAEQRNAFRQALSDNYAWMIPYTRQELVWFTLGLSLSAGLCEELLFRAFLIGVLSEQLGTLPSLLLSSAAFGICHCYQGWKNIIRTALIGLLLGVVFIFTELLWVVVIIHTAIDAYGGLVGYMLNKTEIDKPFKTTV